MNNIMRQYNVGDEVFCRPSGLPIVGVQIDKSKTFDRREGVYTVVKAWFPDTWRYPLVQFLECEDNNGIYIFASSEVLVVLDDF